MLTWRCLPSVDAVNKHKKYFVDNDDNEQADSRSLGAAAAMQALKKFNSGEEDKSSGKSESKFLALAMAEASKVRLHPAPRSPLFLNSSSLSR